MRRIAHSLLRSTYKLLEYTCVSSTVIRKANSDSDACRPDGPMWLAKPITTIKNGPLWPGSFIVVVSQKFKTAKWPFITETDFPIWRSSTGDRWINQSSAGVPVVHCRMPGDIRVPAYYRG